MWWLPSVDFFDSDFIPILHPPGTKYKNCSSTTVMVLRKIPFPQDLWLSSKVCWIRDYFGLQNIIITMLINTIKIMIKKEINVKKYTKRIGQRIDLDGFQITLFSILMASHQNMQTAPVTPGHQLQLQNSFNIPKIVWISHIDTNAVPRGYHVFFLKFLNYLIDFWDWGTVQD